MDGRLIADIYRQLMQNAAGKPGPAILAIDGRCASGKTTLGSQLAVEWGADLIHMDDFFLRPEQRTPERFAQPGENIDHERFLEEVLQPLRAGGPFSYRPYRPHEGRYEDPIRVVPEAVTIIEGSYACHPKLRDYYDLRIFLDVDPEEQMRRITARSSPEIAESFRNRWIPLEELYFTSLNVREVCDMIIENN